ncbi:unnamed protein product, partial [Brachionus calyciflorus]
LTTVCYNIYASGKKPWKNEDGGEPQSYSDGKIEIVSFQTADFMLLQIGVHGDHITQASKIRIVTASPLPMQVDGEPCLLQSSEIIIEHKNQASMVLASEETTVLSTCVQATCSWLCCCCCCCKTRISSDEENSSETDDDEVEDDIQVI